MDASPTELRRRFEYHAPDDHKREGHENVREDCWSIAGTWAVHLPEGREKAVAITKLEEAMFWANAAIARSGK